MKKLISILFLMIMSGQVNACPLCMGSNPNDKYFFYVIVTFIVVATFVILFVIQTALKYRNINNRNIEDIAIKGDEVN
jgi:membrane protein YdbS with pleckstrin-like domain